MASLRRFFAPDPHVTHNPTPLGLRMAAWGDRQRWPWNYAFGFAMVLFLALMGIGAALSVTNDAMWWRLGLALGGGAACVEAGWRLHARGSLWILDLCKVRAQQAKNIASSRLWLQLALPVAIIMPAVVAGSPALAVFFAFFGVFLVTASAIRAVSAFRHRTELRAFTDLLHRDRAQEHK